MDKQTQFQEDSSIQGGQLKEIFKLNLKESLILSTTGFSMPYLQRYTAEKIRVLQRETGEMLTLAV